MNKLLVAHKQKAHYTQTVACEFYIQHSQLPAVFQELASQTSVPMQFVTQIAVND